MVAMLNSQGKKVAHTLPGSTVSPLLIYSSQPGGGLGEGHLHSTEEETGQRKSCIVQARPSNKRTGQNSNQVLLTTSPEVPRLELPHLTVLLAIQFFHDTLSDKRNSKSSIS